MTSLFLGLTWQDDITQQVISRELSKLRRIPLHHQAAPPSPLTTYSSSRDRKLRPSEAELNRNLQQYLTSLGFLPQAAVAAQSGIQRQEADVQVKFSHFKSKGTWHRVEIRFSLLSTRSPTVLKCHLGIWNKISKVLMTLLGSSGMS